LRRLLRSLLSKRDPLNATEDAPHAEEAA